MKLCFPVIENKGIESVISNHFGSAPFFMIVDTESNECELIPNSNAHHSEGMCHPLSVLSGKKFDGIVVEGIGLGALSKLNSANIKVYKSESSSIKETISSYKNGKLTEITPNLACGHHYGKSNLGCGPRRNGRANFIR